MTSAGSDDLRKGRGRSKLTLYGLLFCIALLPLVVWMQVRSSQLSALQQTDSEARTPTPGFRLDPRQVLFWDNPPATVDVITPEFRSMASEIEADLQGIQSEMIERTESDLCKADPHLAKALSDFEETPFASPSSILQHQVNAKSLFLIPILIEDYGKYSKDSPELKKRMGPAILAALESFFLGKGAKALDGVSELASQSTDPMVLYCLMLGSQSQEEYYQAALRAHNASRSRKIHPALTFLIETKLFRYRTKVPFQKLGEAGVHAIDAIVELLQKYQNDKQMVEFLIRHFDEFLRRLDCNEQMELVKALNSCRSPKCPPWAIHYALSKVYSSIGARYRGGDFISNVSPEALRHFEEFSNREIKHLIYAWTQAPEHPALATALLSIEGRAGGTGRTTDAWFRHAISRQLDYSEALDQYTMYCQPRWGGSDEKLFWLSRKFSDCVGVDSDIPFYFWSPLRDFCEDHSCCESLGHAGALVPTLRILDYLKSLPESSPSPNVYEYRSAMILRVLWDSGSFNEARWFLKHYGESFSQEHLSYYRLHLDFVKSVCHAAQKEASDCWQVIWNDLLIESGELTDERIAGLELAIKEASMFANDDESRTAVQHCRQLLEWAKSFHQGEVTELKFSENLDGWLCTSKHSVIDERTIEIESEPAKNSATLLPMLRFSLPYRIEADIVASKIAGDPYGIAIQAGPQGNQDLSSRGAEIRFAPGRHLVALDELPRNVDNVPNENHVELEEIYQSYSLALEIHDREAKAFLNGREFATTSGPFHTLGIVQFARRTAVYYADIASGPTIAYQVSNIKIRRLEPSQTNLLSLEEKPRSLTNSSGR